MLDRTFWELLPSSGDWASQVFASKYPEYASLRHAEQLFMLGHRVVGGLETFIETPDDEICVTDLAWLEDVRRESVGYYMRQIDRMPLILGSGAPRNLNPMTSYGGQRPKCSFEDEDGLWIAKFNLPNDPYDMALGEHLAMELVRRSGVQAAESKVIQLPSGENVFCSKRFDRDGDERHHSLSLYALAPGNVLNRNPMMPGHPGGFMHRLVLRYSDFASADAMGMVSKFLLDIALNNTDNHLRNLRMILNRDHRWELAPLFDVTCDPFNGPHKYNPAGLPLSELYLQNEALPQAMARELLGASHAMSQSREVEMLAELIDSRRLPLVKLMQQWEPLAQSLGLSEQDRERLGSGFSLGMDRGAAHRDMEKPSRSSPTFSGSPFKW